ncbi:outer membrane protein assembly factor BamE [Bdellovibrio sp. HCB337]|uniref:outer membrane protein assembly factor BamE domain-containing protein n=1 Tax=Bdellovibrio sp. HCB337 TaxID=3394358 RepID=UPI0039A585AA
MSRSILAFTMVIGSFLLLGCQTNMLKAYQKVTPGMEKDDVLEVMGSPQRTQRFHGKDRWTYVFYEDRVRYEKEVQFFEGNAIYVGEPWQPEVTAAQVDAKNEAENKAIEDDNLKKYQDNPKAYSNYESEVRGTDKVRYVPTFKPVQ